MAQVLIIGAGPTGLLIGKQMCFLKTVCRNQFLGSLLQDQGVNVTIYEKRKENTRTRPVKLSGRILNVNLNLNDDEYETIFLDEKQIEEREKAIGSMKHELETKITTWMDMATPIQEIQDELVKYFKSSGGIIHTGNQYDVSKKELLQGYPLVIDCSGYHSVLRDQIQPDNIQVRFGEYVIVWTFDISARYECDEMCKYHKNREAKSYQVIPSVHDTYIGKTKMTHMTSLVTIDKNTFDQLAQVKPLTFDYLNNNFPEIVADMDNFLTKLVDGHVSRLPINVMEFLALPLHAYRAKKMTRIVEENDVKQTWVLMGDAAIGGPYFQSISIGYEAAIYFAYIFKRTEGDVMLTKYENYLEKLWFKIQVRSKEIQRNKEILKALCVDDIDAVLNNIKIY